MQGSFPKQLESLPRIFDFISAFTSTCGIDDDTALAINLAIEEAFVNMIAHNTVTGRDAVIGLELENARVIIDLIDYDVEPFNPAESREVDVTQPLHERPIGGLGIHLIKSLMDTVTYEYSDRTSRIRLIKNVESQHA